MIEMMIMKRDNDGNDKDESDGDSNDKDNNI